jgi:hypothetical protein
MRILTTAPRVAALTAAACAALTVTACSGSTHHAAPTGAITTSPSTSTRTSATPTSTAVPSKAMLKTMLLAAADFPKGWSDTPTAPQAGEAQTRAAFAQCAGVPNSSSDQLAEVQGDEFTEAQFTISSVAFSFASTTSVNSDVAAVIGPKATSCFKDLVSSQVANQVPAGGTIGDIAVTVTPVGGATRGLVARIAAHITVTVAGQPITAYLDVAFLAGSHVEAQATFEGIGAPVDAVLEARLIQTMTSRVNAAG